MRLLFVLPLAFFASAAIGGGLLYPWGGLFPAEAKGVLAGCRAVDGDTLRCGEERIRLLGIDAPELPGHCRRGRVCVAGDPHAATRSLRSALRGPLSIERVGSDRYGRTLARVEGAKGDLSCWQLRAHHAAYKGAWDNGYRVARHCPGAALALW